MIKVKVKGLDTVVNALKEFDIPNTDIKQVLVEEGNFMSNVIKGNIPAKSGKMKTAFRVFASDKYPTSVMLGYEHKVFRDKTSVAGLASILEFGSPEQSIGRSPKGKKGGEKWKVNKKGERYLQVGSNGQFYTLKTIPAKPAIAPVRRGFDSSERTVQSSMSRKLNELLKKEAKKKNLKTK